MDKKDKLNDWIMIDVVLQKKLKNLQALNKEREILISKTEKQGIVTPLLEQELNESLLK